MPFPTITTAPTAPTRAMTNDEFIAAADAFVAWMATLDTQINAWSDYAAAFGASLGVNDADAEILALAGLVSAANKLPYFTGSGTAALADLTAFARTILADADAAAARGTLGLGTAAEQAATAFLQTANNLSDVASPATARANLGVAIGTDVQAFDADLAAIAALATTTFGRSLLTQADAAAARTTIGAQEPLTHTSNANGHCISLGIGGTTFKLQWGSITASANTNSTITFPVAFTSAASCVCNGVGEFDTGVQATQPTVRSVGTTTATVFSGSEVSCTAWWIAIGS